MRFLMLCFLGIWSLKAFGFQIAIMADFQQQTAHPLAYERYTLYNTKFADYIIDHAIRPPAGSFLGAQMIGYWGELEEVRRADLILVLGDMANHGCVDELDTILRELKKLSQRLKKPVFLAPGNHDYLASGNSPRLSHRLRLCGSRDNIVYKKDLLERIVAFHNEQELPPSFELIHAPKPSTWEEACGATLSRQHLQPGCHLVTLIRAENSPYDLMVFDSSDYADDQGHPLAKLNFFGGFGAVSESQAITSKSLLLARPQQKEVLVASHYPIKSLNQSIPRILHHWPKPPVGWFSAHTHQGSEPEGEELPMWFIREWNTGSSIDDPIQLASYELAPLPKGPVGRHRVTRLSTMPFIKDERGLCRAVFDYMSVAGPATEEDFQTLAGREQGFSLFGVTKLYRHARFQAKRDIPKIAHNIEVLKKKLAPLILWPELSVCLGFGASLFEAEVFFDWYEGFSGFD